MSTDGEEGFDLCNLQTSTLSEQLIGLLGLEGFVKLCDAAGGTRLYVPSVPKDDHLIVLTVGKEAAARLASVFSPDTIRVPLGRDQRASFYRDQGWSSAKIALKLGITENGVSKLFKRISETVK